MLVRYQFVNGEISEVEVSQEIGEVVLALEYEQALRERTETRRHVQLSALDVEGGWFADESDPLDGLLTAEDQLVTWQAIDQLTKKQRDMLDALYLASKPISPAEYASLHDLNITSVRQSLWRIRAAIRKYLDDV